MTFFLKGDYARLLTKTSLKIIVVSIMFKAHFKLNIIALLSACQTNSENLKNQQNIIVQ